MLSLLLTFSYAWVPDMLLSGTTPWKNFIFSGDSLTQHKFIILQYCRSEINHAKIKVLSGLHSFWKFEERICFLEFSFPKTSCIPWLGTFLCFWIQQWQVKSFIHGIIPTLLLRQASTLEPCDFIGPTPDNPGWSSYIMVGWLANVIPPPTQIPFWHIM